MKKYLTLFVLAITVIACQKDEGSNPAEPFRLASSKSYVYGNNDWVLSSTTTYSYTSFGKLLNAETVSPDGQLINRTTYTYEAEQKLIKKDLNGSDWYEYTYKNNGEVDKRTYYQSNKKLAESVFEYNNDKIIKEHTQWFNSSSPYYINYTYQKDNIIGLKLYDLSNVLLEEHMVQYDNKINPFYQTLDRSEVNYTERSGNNLMWAEIVYSKNHVPANGASLYGYEYNSQGYPITKYFKFVNAARWMTKTVYTYEPQ